MDDFSLLWRPTVAIQEEQNMASNSTLIISKTALKKIKGTQWGETHVGSLYLYGLGDVLGMKGCHIT